MERDARELIVDIYRQLTEVRARGDSAIRVVMSRADYESIQRYRAMLGDVPEGMADYIAQYEVFGLEICVDDTTDPRVE